MADQDETGSHASSFDEADDQDWADWVGDDDDEGGNQAGTSRSTGLQTRVQYHALFRDGTGTKLTAFGTPKDALEHCVQQGCNIPDLIRRLDLDALQVIRLFNHIRRQGLDANTVEGLQGNEVFLNDDAELKAVPGYENDGLLQLDFDDLDAELASTAPATTTKADGRPGDKQRIAALEAQVQASHLAIQDLRQRLAERLGLDDLDELSSDDDGTPARQRNGRAKARAAASVPITEDAYYFSSYASHDIHQTMIADKVRTLSYAKFILAPENAHLFRGKVVMDVGCGSGILSMFAARAGAREVIAIDASAVASRARENVRQNRLDGIITVHHGRVEALDATLQQYRGQVDVIVSEWMGYFLLYESMMPAVLYARDRYLRQPGGLLAPSHTRMLLSAVADCDVITERFGFWDNVHGFTMNAMKTGLADEAWTDMLKPEQIVTSTETLLELPLHTIAPHQPSFSAPFALRVTRDCTIQAFVSWFDTWFTPDGKPVPRREADNDGADSDSSDGDDDWDGQIEAGKTLPGLPPVTTTCPTEEEVRGLHLQRDAIVPKAEDIVDSKGLTVSFTTSPFGPETHWKQTLFVLKEPIEATAGTMVVGLLRSTPNEENLRELDVEIHYSLRQATQPAQVRRKSVEARTVQLFAVR